jgi:sugar phosphate isomerase/epimerase
MVWAKAGHLGYFAKGTHMQIGAMNHPARPVLEQIEWIGKSGLEFLDLTLEPPGAASWNIDAAAVRRALKEHKLGVVGHTAPYLPVASPMEGVRRAAVAEFRRCLNVFHEVGARWMNIHPGTAPMHERRFSIAQNLASLEELLETAREQQVGIMIENIPGAFNSATQMGELFDPLPELGLHLDLGHTNLMTHVNTTNEIMAAYGQRLRHVHLHDNRGGNLDLHLPLGAGNLNVADAVRTLKASHYEGTITLEVFASDPNLLLHSRDVLRRVWDEVGSDIATTAVGATPTSVHENR